MCCMVSNLQHLFIPKCMPFEMIHMYVDKCVQKSFFEMLLKIAPVSAPVWTMCFAKQQKHGKYVIR